MERKRKDKTSTTSRCAAKALAAGSTLPLGSSVTSDTNAFEQTHLRPHDRLEVASSEKAARAAHRTSADRVLELDPEAVRWTVVSSPDANDRARETSRQPGPPTNRPRWGAVTPAVITAVWVIHRTAVPQGVWRKNRIHSSRDLRRPSGQELRFHVVGLGVLYVEPLLRFSGHAHWVMFRVLRVAVPPDA